MASLLVVGSVAYDTVETVAGRSEEQLGGSATFFSLAAALFVPVHVVAVVGKDFRETDLQLFRERGIDCSGLQIRNGKTFRWGGRYSSDFSERETLFTELNVFETFDPDIPQHLRSVKYVFLANIGPDLQLRVLEQMESPQFVAMDTMNFWIERDFGRVKEVISRVHGIVVNDEEARQLTGRQNLPEAMEIIRSWGPKMVIVKKGEHGAVLLLEDGFFFLPAYPVRAIVDPTGAGDTFAGGLMGYLAHAQEFGPQVFRKAVVYGSAAASFNVEGFGVEKLKEISKSDILLRCHDFHRMTSFELP